MTEQCLFVKENETVDAKPYMVIAGISDLSLGTLYLTHDELIGFFIGNYAMNKLWNYLNCDAIDFSKNVSSEKFLKKVSEMITNKDQYDGFVNCGKKALYLCSDFKVFEKSGDKYYKLVSIYINPAEMFHYYLKLKELY